MATHISVAYMRAHVYGISVENNVYMHGYFEGKSKLVFLPWKANKNTKETFGELTQPLMTCTIEAVKNTSIITISARVFQKA